MGLEGKELFSYAMVNCKIFSEPPDGIDVSELNCIGQTIQPSGQCKELDDSELGQLCNNNMCTLCIINFRNTSVIIICCCI
jgi:hypothetical protein